ncbi:hypothetical protein SDJN03_16915, partial [Cucurbita argyrosperma subsp. sororia]
MAESGSGVPQQVSSWWRCSASYSPTAGNINVKGRDRGRSVHGEVCRSMESIDGAPYVIIGKTYETSAQEMGMDISTRDYGPAGAVLKPPSGDVATDAMVISMASGLAAVGNQPVQYGFFQLGQKASVIEAYTDFPGMSRGGLPWEHWE